MRDTSSSIYQQRTNASRDNSIMDIKAIYEFEHISAKNEMHVEITQSWR